jgi:WD40 repeat protein
VSGKELLALKGHTARLNSVAWSSDGSRLATASSDETIRIWDATTGNQLLSLPDHGYAGLVGRAAFSADGKRIATSSTASTAKVWDISATLNPSTGSGQNPGAITGKELLTLCCHPPGATAFSFSPDGTRLATAGLDGLAKVWDSTTGKELLTLSGHTSPLSNVRYSPDGKRVATGGTDGAKVWDAATGQALLTLSGHTGSVNAVAFSSDGTRLATSGGDGTVKLWNVAIGSGRSEQPFTLYDPRGRAIWSAAFSPDGKRLATSNNDGIARVYALPLGDIIAIAKTRVTRALTTDECEKYLHVEKCPESP